MRLRRRATPPLGGLLASLFHASPSHADTPTENLYPSEPMVHESRRVDLDALVENLDPVMGTEIYRDPSYRVRRSHRKERPNEDEYQDLSDELTENLDGYLAREDSDDEQGDPRLRSGVGYGSLSLSNVWDDIDEIEVELDDDYDDSGIDGHDPDELAVIQVGYEVVVSLPPDHEVPSWRNAEVEEYDPDENNRGRKPRRTCSSHDRKLLAREDPRNLRRLVDDLASDT